MIPLQLGTHLAVIAHQSDADMLTAADRFFLALNFAFQIANRVISKPVNIVNPEFGRLGTRNINALLICATDPAIVAIFTKRLLDVLTAMRLTGIRLRSGPTFFVNTYRDIRTASQIPFFETLNRYIRDYSLMSIALTLGLRQSDAH